MVVHTPSMCICTFSIKVAKHSIEVENWAKWYFFNNVIVLFIMVVLLLLIKFNKVPTYFPFTAIQEINVLISNILFVIDNYPSDMFIIDFRVEINCITVSSWFVNNSQIKQTNKRKVI